MDFLKAIDRFLGRAMRWISVACLVGLMLVLTGVVFIRFVPIATLSWSDEAIEWAFAWMVFLGAAALWRDNQHFYVEALETQLRGTVAGRILGLAIELCCITFFIVFTYYSYQLTVNANDRSPILEWPRPLWYSAMPLAGGLMIVYSIRNVVKKLIDLTGKSPNQPEETV